MSDPTFAQSERRSYTLPAVLALALLAAAVAIAVHFFPATSVNVAHVRTQILPTRTVFKSDSIVVGPAQTSDVLFAASTLRIDNQTRAPITLDNFSCTFTDPAGAILTVKPLTAQKIPNAETSFPALKPLLPAPLRLETSIPPGQSAEGQILLSFPFTQAQWDARKSVSIEVDLYHLPPSYVEIPKPTPNH